MPSIAWLVAACLLSGSATAPVPCVTAAATTVTRTSSESADGKAEPTELAPVRIGPILLTGYAHFDGIFPLGDHAAGASSTFRVRRARVYASGDLLPKIGFVFGVDVTDSSPLRDVYVTLRQVDAANVRVGQFIAPYSLERLTSTKDLEAIDRVVDRFVPSRDMGAMVFNATPFFGQLSYSVAVINGTGQNNRDDNDAKDVVGRVVWRVPTVKTVSLAVNAASGRQPAGRRNDWGADVNIDRGPFRIAAEYVHQTRPLWAGVSGHGFYLLARRQFRPASARPDFYMAEAIVRLVELRDPSEIVGNVGGGRRREVQAGANYYFSRNVRIMTDAFLPLARAVGSPRATIATRVQFMF